MTRHPHEGPAHDVTAPGPGDTGQEALCARLDELQQEVASLRESLTSRQRTGFVAGLLGQRYGLDPDEASALLARVSRELGVEVHRVADVVSDVYGGRLDPDDAALATAVARLLPEAPGPAASTGDERGREEERS